MTYCNIFDMYMVIVGLYNNFIKESIVVEFIVIIIYRSGNGMKKLKKYIFSFTSMIHRQGMSMSFSFKLNSTLNMQIFYEVTENFIKNLYH